MTMNEIITETKRPLFILIWYTGFRGDVHRKNWTENLEYTILFFSGRRIDTLTWSLLTTEFVVYDFYWDLLWENVSFEACVAVLAWASFLPALIGFRLWAATERASSLLDGRRAPTLVCVCVWMKTAGFRILIDEWAWDEGTRGKRWWHSFFSILNDSCETSHNYKRKYWLLQRSGGVSPAMLMKRNENKHSSDK